MEKLLIEKFFPGRGNTRALLEMYAKECGADACGPGGALYIVPTRRKARQVRDMLMARSGAVLGQVVVTFDDIVDEAGRKAAEGPVINEAKKLVLLEDAVSDDGAGINLPGRAASFPGTVTALSKIIAELKQNGIMSAAELERKGGAGGRIMNAVAAAYRAYEARKTPAGNESGKPLLDAEDLAARAAGYIEKNGLASLYPRTGLVVFDGFYDFNLLQKNIVEQVIRTAGRTVFALEVGGGTAEDRRRYEQVFRLADGLLEFLRGLGVEYAEKWNEPVELLRPRAARNLFVSLADYEDGHGSGEPVTLMEARDREEEVRLIAESIKRRMVDAGPGGFDPAGTAVVFPALDKYSQYVREWFPRYGVPFSIQAGEPLNAAAVSDLFLAMLEAAEGGFARSVVFRLLSFPFISFEKLNKEFGGDGIWFQPDEFDSIARESQIVGGQPSLGHEEWVEKLNRMLDSLKSRAAGAAEDDDPEKSDVDKLARKYSRVDFYAKCFGRMIEWFGPLLKDGEISTAEYFECLHELMESFGVERSVYSSDVAGVPDARRATNVMALRGLMDALVECRAALELVKGGRKMTPARFGDYVRAAVRGKSLSPRGQGHGVAVMGALETRSLRMDSVYIGGLLDGEFPRTVSEYSLLSDRECESLGMSSIRKEVAEDRMILFRLLACVQDVTISYPQWEGGKECLRSVFVDAVAGDPEPDTEKKNPDPAAEVVAYERETNEKVFTLPQWLCETGRAAESGMPGHWAGLLRELRDEKRRDVFVNMLKATSAEAARNAPDFNEYTGAMRSDDLRRALAEKFLNSKREFSATQLEMYARCPFRFYSHYVLGLGAPEEVEEEVTPMTVGSLLHDVLCEFFKNRRPDGGGPAERVTTENMADAEQQMRDIAEKKMKEYVFTGVFWDRKKEEILRGLCGGAAGAGPGVLKDFLLREAELPPQISPAYFELEFSNRAVAKGGKPGTVFPGYRCAAGGGEAQFKGRVDRIDVAAMDGKKYWLVLDYKSGKPKAISLTMDGIDFQLPLYMMFIRELMEEGDEYVGGAYDYLLGGSKERGRRGLFVRKKFVAKKPDPAALFVSQARTGPMEDAEFGSKLAELEGRIAGIVESIISGWFHESPLGAGAGCDYCDFAAVCRDTSDTVSRLERLMETPEGKSVYVPASVFKEEAGEEEGGEGE